VLPEPRIIVERFIETVGELEARLGEDPECSRPALIEAIGDRIVLQPDVSGRFLWAEYGLAGERLVASLAVQKIMVAGA
jgi:hypothetical protein